MSNTGFKIRKAQLDDLEILKVFEQEIITFERPFGTNLKKDPIIYYDIKDLIKRFDAEVLVIVVNNQLVGSGYALIKKSPAYKKPERYAYLGFMYVVPNHRGKGLNGALCAKLIDWAKKHDINEVQLDVYAENKSALNAYSKIGFKPDLLKMRL